MNGGWGVGGALLAFVVACKQRWCSSVDEETKMMFFCGWWMCLERGVGGVGGGYWPSLLLANKDDVLRWMRKRRWCSSVDDECVCNGGWGGWGGVTGLRCCLQTKMMFFGGWGNKDDVLRWRGGFWRLLLLTNKDDVLRWMMNVFVRGVGGLLAFVVACKQRWCSSVDDETKMMFFCGWWMCL